MDTESSAIVVAKVRQSMNKHGSPPQAMRDAVAHVLLERYLVARATGEGRAFAKKYFEVSRG